MGDDSTRTWHELIAEGPGREDDPPSQVAQDWLQHVPGDPETWANPERGRLCCVPLS